MTLNNGLNTIELGSTNWRNILNIDLEILDKNRFFIVNTTAELPTSFKGNRFFLNLEDSTLKYDNSIELIDIAGGGSGSGQVIDLLNHPNRFIKINSNGTDFDYIVDNFLTNKSGAGGSTFAIGGTNTQVFSAYSNSFGYENSITNSQFYNNIFGNYCSINNSGYYNFIFGAGNANNSGDSNILIGSNIQNEKSETISIGSNIITNNNCSFNTKINNCQNSIFYYKKSAFSSSSLTSFGLYGNTKLNFINGNLYNIKGRINIANPTLTQVGTYEFNLICAYNSYNVLSIKHFSKSTIFQDTYFDGFDFDFAISSDNLDFLVNTNSILLNLSAKFDCFML